MKKQLELSDVIANVRQGVQYLDKEIKSGVKYTILIGPTGAGKSTLTNVLTGHKIKMDKINQKKVFVVDGESLIKIGHTNQSETMHPNIVGAYIDCPGFGDTDPTKELQNAIYIKKVFESNNQEKVLIVTEYSSIFSEKAKSFIELLKNIDGSMGNNFLPLSKQFGLCVSKVPSDEYEQEITDNPNAISEIIQAQLTESTYPQGVDLIKSLEDRVFFFMKNDSHSSVEKKLKTLMTKICFGNKILVSPILSLEGNHAIDSMIEEVFGITIKLNRESIDKYLYTTKDSFKLSSDATLSSIMIKLEEYVGTCGKLIDNAVSEVKSTNTMDQLVDKLLNFADKVKKILILSVDRLESVKIIAKVYPKSDELSQNYKLKMAEIFSPVIKFGEKINSLVKDVNLMDHDWSKLKDLTTTSSITKGLIITGGVVGSIGLGIATGGAFLVYEGIVAGGVLVLGTSATIGFTVLWKKAAESCNAYEENHPEVIPVVSDLKNHHKKLPDKFAKLWVSSHNPEKSEYLPDLQIVLLGTQNDDYNSDYNDVFGN